MAGLEELIARCNKGEIGDSHDLKTQGQSELHGHGNILGKEIRPGKQKAVNL